MTDQLNSQLSAFVDEALSEGESELLVRRLCRDTDLRATLARYSLIGDVLRGDLAVPASGSFARRVMMAVDGQPVPQTETPDHAKPRRMRMLGAAAVAVMALGIVAVVTSIDTGPEQPLAALDNDPPDLPTQAPLTLVAADPVERDATTPVSYNVPMLVPANRQPQEARAQLNSYLVQHLSTAGPRQGLMTYRNVGYNQPERPR